MRRYIFTDVELRDRWAQIEANRKNIKNQDLNYLNSRSCEETNKKNNTDLNYLNTRERKISRFELWSDKVLQRALEWGFDERVLRICIQEYGEDLVKYHINRIHALPDGYFQARYGPVAQQRGKCFNMEMQKLRRKKA